MALVDTTTDTGAEATNSPNTGAAAGPTPQARGPLALPAMQGAPGPGPTPELGESGSDDGYGVDDDAALSAPAVVAGAPYASLADALASVPEFGAMSGAVAALGLADALRNPQLKATLFVPTDAAFRDAAARVGVSFAQLQQRYPRPMVQLVLFYHMVRNEAVRAPLPARALPTYNLGESLQGEGMRVKGRWVLDGGGVPQTWQGGGRARAAIGVGKQGGLVSRGISGPLQTPQTVQSSSPWGRPGTFTAWCPGQRRLSTNRTQSRLQGIDCQHSDAQHPLRRG
jgi:hypothetical protein